MAKKQAVVASGEPTPDEELLTEIPKPTVKAHKSKAWQRVPGEPIAHLFSGNEGSMFTPLCDPENQAPAVEKQGNAEQCPDCLCHPDAECAVTA
jgi:hypothetical protein